MEIPFTVFDQAVSVLKVIGGLVVEGQAGSMLMMVLHGAGGRYRDLEVNLSSLTEAGLRQESVSFSAWHLSFSAPSLLFQISPSGNKVL